ncbi:MAG TPA: type II secretion system protein GspE, partial [Chromatiales bacterium]|nr:type II secretion system protein GspE [Chromatiales bacterium]
VVDETARRLVHDGASEQALERHARARTPSLREDGLRRVLAGETSAEELLRVTREEA